MTASFAKALSRASLVLTLLIAAHPLLAHTGRTRSTATVAYRLQPKAAKGRTAGVGWTFRDIDVQTLLERLKRFGVEMPVPLEGRVTVRLALRAPLRSLLRPGAYEVEGDLSSSRLKVAGVELETLAVHLFYTEGAFELTKMSFTVPDAKGRDGTVSGSARMQVRPRGDLSVQLKVGNVPLATLLDSLPELAEKASGTATGQLAGQVPTASVRDLSAWQAQGRLNLNNLQALGLPPAAISTEFRLAGGQATLTNLSAKIEGASLTASGNLVLRAPYNFAARLQAGIPDLAWLSKLDADFRPPADVAGSFTLNADANGSLDPKRIRLRGALDGRNLKVNRLAIDRLVVPYEGTLDRIRLNGARADLYGGQIVANFSLPTQLNGNVGVGVRVSNVDLGAVASAALQDPQPWRGSASGTLQLQAPLNRITDFDTWSGQGDLSLANGDLFGLEVSRIAANVRVNNGELVVNSLAAESTLARVTGSARVNLTAPFGFSTALRLENVDFSQLNGLTAIRLPATIGGRAGISATAQGTLQPLRLSARGGLATRGLRAENMVFDTLDLRFTADSGDDPRDLAKWQAQLNGTWSGARVDRAALPAGSVSAQLSDGTLDISRLRSENGPMLIDASGQVGVIAPYEFALKLQANNVDAALANGLPIRPPIAVAGVVSTSANAKGELRPLKIDGSGKLDARNLRVRGTAIDSLRFDFAADNDSVAISELSVVAYRGRINGSVNVPLSQAAQANLDLRWERINLGRAFADLSEAVTDFLKQNGLTRLSDAVAEGDFDGWTWGKVVVQAPAGKLFDPSAWTGDVDFSLAEIRLAEWPVKKAFVRGQLAQGKAELTRLAFDFDQARLRGTARLELAQPYNFTSQLSLDRVNLADFNRLPESIRPPTSLGGEVSLSIDAGGTIEPLEITGSGSLKGNHIQAGGATLDRVNMALKVEPRRLTLTQFHADFYEGTIEGTAQIGLKADEPGEIDFAWKGVDLGHFVTEVGHLPVSLRGKLDGELDIQLPAGKLGEITAWTVDATFDTTPITAESKAVGQVRGHLKYRQGLLDYGVDGTLLRGRIELAGRWQPKGEKSAANEGRFVLSGARLDALAGLFDADSPLGSLTGQINVRLPYHHDETSGLPTGNGDLAIDDIRLNDVAVLNEVRGVVRLSADRVEFTNIEGMFAGGAMNGAAVAFFHPGRRGALRLDIEGAEMAEALAPWHHLASQIRGNVDVRLQGYFGGRRPAQLSGTVAVHHGFARGLEFTSLRVPVVGTFDPVSRHGVLRLHGVSGHFALGRFVGNFDLTLAGGVDLKGHGKFSRLDLRTLLRQSETVRQLASGKVDGTYSVAGRNVRTVADLTGSLKAELTNTQALSLPVFQQTLPYLTGGVSGSTTFDNGELRAHLSRGVVHVDRFSLASGSVQLYADGRVSLAGRLDLNVLVQTGQLNARTQAISFFAARIALFISPPVGLLLEVTQFLSNQVINLEITGTVRSPTVRVQPLKLLGQEAARFFLYEALP